MAEGGGGMGQDEGVPLSPRPDGKEQRQEEIKLKFDRRVYTNPPGISLVGQRTC